MNKKEQRALEAILVWAFRVDEESTEEFFNRDHELSKEDEEAVKKWNIEKVINKIINQN